jgi:hypothetical protein
MGLLDRPGLTLIEFTLAAKLNGHASALSKTNFLTRFQSFTLTQLKICVAQRRGVRVHSQMPGVFGVKEK